MHLSVTKRLRRKPWCWYLARCTFGTQKLLLGILATALCVARRCRERAKLYVGAHKAVGRETSDRQVDPYSLLSCLQDDLIIIGRRTSTVERSIEMASDGEPGLYPGGKSPRRNQHDRGERSTRIRTMLPESFRITFRDRRFRSQRGADYSYIAKELCRSCIPIRAIVPISSRGVGRNCFLLSKAHLILFRHDFLDLFGVSNKDLFLI